MKDNDTLTYRCIPDVLEHWKCLKCKRKIWQNVLGWEILKEKFKYPVLIEKVIGCEESAEKQ